MKDNQWEIPSSAGATQALMQYQKYITPDVLIVAEQKAAGRCKDRDWRKHAAVTRVDVEKAVRECHDIPAAEFIICTLAQSIHVLARKLGEDWMTKDFDADAFYEQMGVWSSGERLAGLARDLESLVNQFRV